MAITQWYNFEQHLVGDGSSTSVTVDLGDAIEYRLITPRVPSSVVSYSSGFNISSATLSGQALTLSFSVAPASGALGNIEVALAF